MTFHEKLRRRAGEVNKSKVSRAVGLKPNVISTYIAKASLPRADIAFKIALALEVPLNWLLDDTQDWPPPKVESPLALKLSDVPYSDLIRELARRFRLDLLEGFSKLEDAKKVDWSKAVAKAKKLKPDDKAPVEIIHLVAKAKSVIESAVYVATRYNIHVAADFFHDQLPGHDRPVENVQYLSLMVDYLALEKQPDFEKFVAWMNEHAQQLRDPNLLATLALSKVLPIIDDRYRAAALQQEKSKA